MSPSFASALGATGVNTDGLRPHSELIKGTPKDHPASKYLAEANEAIGDAAKQINEALRQHERLGKFFGSDEMLNPASSERSKDGKFKQGYVDA